MISGPTKEWAPTLRDKQWTGLALENPVLLLSEVRINEQVTLLIPDEKKSFPQFFQKNLRKETRARDACTLSLPYSQQSQVSQPRQQNKADKKDIIYRRVRWRAAEK